MDKKSKKKEPPSIFQRSKEKIAPAKAHINEKKNKADITKVTPLVQDKNIFDAKVDPSKEGSIDHLLKNKSLKELIILSELLNRKDF